MVKLIKEYRETNGDPPIGMQAFYDYTHEAQMKRASLIQLYINEYSDN